jgi:hypothetical protein
MLCSVYAHVGMSSDTGCYDAFTASTGSQHAASAVYALVLCMHIAYTTLVAASQCIHVVAMH